MLDFYKIIDKKKENLLFSLKEEFLLKIDTELKSKNINIDLYGTTRLYQSHISTIINILKFHKLEKSDFYQFLIEIEKDQESLIIEGD